MELPRFTPGHGQAKLTESVFQRQLVGQDGLATWLGWRSYHTRYSPGSDAGYPDLTLVHPVHGLLWLELKGGVRSSHPSVEQVAWLRALRDARQHAYLVHPADIEVVDLLLRGKVPYPTSAIEVAPHVQHLLEYEMRTR